MFDHTSYLDDFHTIHTLYLDDFQTYIHIYVCMYVNLACYPDVVLFFLLEEWYN